MLSTVTKQLLHLLACFNIICGATWVVISRDKDLIAHFNCAHLFQFGFAALWQTPPPLNSYFITTINEK